MFFGTPEWAVPSLEALLAAETEVVAVVTNPDRPAGRGMALRMSPVKQAAESAGIRVLQPARARDPEFIEAIRDLTPDVAVVVAYGKILPLDLLEVPPHGFVNVHFSVLPAYRGAAPVQRAIMEGAATTGVSIMVLTEGMDEGPVLAVDTTPVAPTDTAATVGERLAVQGAKLLAETLPTYVDGSLLPKEQDHASATYASKLSPEEARIDWSWDAERIDRFVRGLDPMPGAWTTLGGKRLKVRSMALGEDSGTLAPGELAAGAALTVGTGSVPVELTEVQLEGKKRMSGIELRRGLRLDEGVRLV